MSRLEAAVKAAFEALLAEKLQDAATRRDPPRLALTKGQREELVRRVTAQVKAPGEQRGPIHGGRGAGLPRRDDTDPLAKEAEELGDTIREAAKKRRTGVRGGY